MPFLSTCNLKKRTNNFMFLCNALLVAICFSATFNMIKSNHITIMIKSIMIMLLYKFCIQLQITG